MAKANHIITDTQLGARKAEVLARIGFAIGTVAEQRAIKEVKRQLQAQGLKLSGFCRREIVVMATKHLAEHPELIAEAKPTALRWFAEGVFGKKAARSVTFVQSARACGAGTLAVQMSCAKWSTGNDRWIRKGVNR